MSEKTAREEMREQMALVGSGAHKTQPISAAMAEIIEKYVDARIVELLKERSIPLTHGER